MSNEIRDWWELQHSKKNIKLLTGMNPLEVWDSFNISRLISTDKHIINIGLGLGYETKEMFKRGIEVYGMDISKKSLENFREYLKEGYLFPEDLNKLPKNFFDLAISHLVTQHMSENDLIKQMKSVIKSLKQEGIFAMQFANSPDKKIERWSLDDQQFGGCIRSLDEMRKTVSKCGGKIIWVKKKEFGKLRSWWYLIHIKRK